MPRLRGASRREMDDFKLQVYRDFPLKHQSEFGTFMKQTETGRARHPNDRANAGATGRNRPGKIPAFQRNVRSGVPLLAKPFVPASLLP